MVLYTLELVDVYKRQILLFATLLAFVISVIFITAHDPLLRLMFGKIEDDVMKASKTYLIITTYSFVALAIYNSCAALFLSLIHI